MILSKGYLLPQEFWKTILTFQMLRMDAIFFDTLHLGKLDFSLQGTNISHLENRKIIFKTRDILVARRVFPKSPHERHFGEGFPNPKARPVSSCAGDASK